MFGSWQPFGRQFLARVVVALFAASLLLARPAAAASSGQIVGSVVAAETKAALGGVRVAITSPSQRYSAVTDERGNFAIAGIEPDTYTLSFEKQGYDPYSISGATVTADQAYRPAVLLTKTLRTIGRASVRARPITSAFQPDQTVDRYTVGSQDIEQLLGKSFDTNAKQLLSELPSVTIDKNGTALVRGGFSFEGGFEFEGIDYTEPNRNLTNRFENLGSNYLLSGVRSLEIIPGGSDATHGNTGTGLIVATAKRGTFPSSGAFDYEIGTLGGGRQLGLELANATQNGRLANFFSYIGEDTSYQYGPYGIPASSIIADPTTQDPALGTLFAAPNRRIYTTAVFNKSFQRSQDLLDNMVVKFGKNGSQAFQFFLQSQLVHQNLNYGGSQILSAIPQEIFYLNNPLANPTNSSLNSLDELFGGGLGVTTALEQQFISRFVPVPYGAPAGAPLQSPEQIDSPFSAYKFEYDNTFDGRTALSVRAYRTDNSANEILPSQGLYVPQSGGIRKGLTFDVTRVLGSKHTLQLGGKFEFAHPFGQRFNYIDYTGAFEGNYTNIGSFINFGAQTHDILADYVLPQAVQRDANGNVIAGTPGCIGAGPQGPATNTIPQEHCGYLYKYFPGGPPGLSAEVETPTANQQVYGLYAQDTFAPNARLRVLAGLRLDGYNFLIPDDPQNPPAVDGIRHQRLYEPHIGIAYRLGAHDAVRAGYGRTLAIPLPTFLGSNIDRSQFAAYENIPSFDSVTGKAATYCGPGVAQTLFNNSYYIGTLPCRNYADQLYWLLRNARFAQQSQITSPLRGATFTNYDLSVSHEFRDGSALKITPFYRRGYDIVETSQTLLGIDPVTGTQQLSPEVQSNLGVQRTTGVELELTTRQRQVGLSGILSMTYINQIGNDPPGEYLPTSSVQLGQLYHSPDLAPFQSTLAATYRTSWGFRINPILTFQSGYPYGSGLYQAFTINGQAVYIPYTDAVYLGAYSSQLSNGSVNPQNPGTISNPNVFATRGTEALTSGPGSLYAHSTLNLDITAAFTPASGKGLTYGISVANLFDRVASVPYKNTTRDCQVVFTGLCASNGTPSVSDPYHGAVTAVGSSTGPYIIYPNQAPIKARIYVQASF